MGAWFRRTGPVTAVLAVLGLSAALAAFLAYRTGFLGSDNRPVQHLGTRVDDAIFPNRQADMASLTRSAEVARVALGQDRPDNPRVRMVLETARRIFDAEIVYVLDPSGTVVACTRYEGGKTLTGNSYAFRPYFIKASQGHEAVYPAMGVTTLVRGLYFSSPIILQDQHVAGVLVVKTAMDEIDAILAADPDPVFLVSPDGVVFASNRPEMLFHTIKPMKPEELERIRASQQFGAQELKPFGAALDGRRKVDFEGGSWSVFRRPILSDWTLLALAKGGPAYVIHKDTVTALAGVVLAMALIIAFLASVIRAREKAEEELRAYREHLEELVETRTAELRDAKDVAEAATRAKSIFLASMSHELRTPLNAILGYAQLLSHGAADPESRDNLGRIHRAGEHLLALINHVLSLSKIEAGKLALDPAPFASTPFFRFIEDLIRNRAVAKGLKFRLEVRRPFPEVLLGDAMKLRQILVNLLGNAVKFTHQGGVGLAVEWAGNRVRFEVSDTGVGMDPDEVAGLFHAFHQTRSGLGSAEGTGLGLHISEAMVRAMGGRMEVESERGRGTVFRLELPMAESPLPPEEPPLPPGLAPGQPGLRMLVVDDVEDNRTLLVRMLSAMGMEVRAAEGGAAALAIWESWRPQVVWMDLRMPAMDGHEAVRRLRECEARQGRPRTVVIALTASALDLEPSAQFDDLVLKPFLETELVDRLHRHCGLELAPAAPVPEALGGIELSPRIRALDPAWVQAFLETLVVGDRAEAQDLLDLLPDRPLAEAFAVQLKQFRFEALRRLIEPGSVHA